MQKIILATKSPYRIEAFKFLELDFYAEGCDIDENFPGRPDDPKKLVLLLAKMKAEAVAKKHLDGFIIGFDSVGLFGDKVLEKPATRQEALERLRQLSGETFYFYTGLYLKNLSTGQTANELVETKVFLREISDLEINKYLDQDPNFKTYAVGFDPLGHYSSTFVSKIEGSYNNFLRGIPLEKITALLFKVGFKLKII